MSGIDGKYGRITAEKKEFRENEPVFLIRGTDALAVETIYSYAKYCQAAGCGQEHIEQIEIHLEKIRKWQQQNNHLVKLPD